MEKEQRIIGRLEATNSLHWKEVANYKKIGHPLCTHAPVGTKCRGKKSFPFVHLLISQGGGGGEKNVLAERGIIVDVFLSLSW